MIASDAGSPTPDAATAAGRGRILGIALAAGLLAGVASWLAGEGILEAYRGVLSPRIRREADPEGVKQFARAHLASASGTFAALSGILGLGLGSAGGLARRSGGSAARAAGLGGLVGAVAGGSVAVLVLPGFFKNHDPQSQDLLAPMLTLGSICAAVGASGGLAFGIGVGGRGGAGKALVGGLVGAALATVAYEVAGAIAFPTGKTELPISATPATRAMLHVLVAVLTAAGAALPLGLSDEKRAGASPAP